MTWGIGANDVANAMGTSVGSGAITVKQAIDPGGDHGVCRRLSGRRAPWPTTISKGIIDGTLFEPVPQLLMFGMIGRAAGRRHLADGGEHAWLAGVDHACDRRRRVRRRCRGAWC
jgi:hypothetical protein